MVPEMAVDEREGCRFLPLADVALSLRKGSRKVWNKTGL